MPDVVVTAISSCLLNTEYMTYFNQKQKKIEKLPKHMSEKSLGSITGYVKHICTNKTTYV